jgi:UDP-glucose:(heptosyl)LPS alpha-1,3-glucosyltransferase
LHETIAALATLPISRQKIGLVVAGGGRPAPFARQIRQLGLDDSVRFLGNVPDSVAVYRAGDVYIQPTYYDPCSLVVLEAMACGLPSITTTINGASELMTPAMGEVIDHPTNLAALRQAMTRFLDDRERATAGEAARAGMARQTLSANSDQLIELYSTRGAQAAA